MLPSFSVTQIDLGFASIQIWGFFVALGFGAALCMSLKEAEKESIDKEIIWDLMIVALLVMIAGGRLFYLLSDWSAGLAGLANIHSGFSLAGGAVASGFAGWAYLKYRKQEWKKIFAMMTPNFIIALIFVRTGCFLVEDHIGKITALPWGMDFIDGTSRHPVALYEILFLAVLYFAVRKIQKVHIEDGKLLAILISSYAVFRFLADFLRCDDMAMCDLRIWGLTATQWISIPIAVFFLLCNKAGFFKKNKEMLLQE